MTDPGLPLTPSSVRTALSTVMDPELNVDIVSLGLIYDISIQTVQRPTGPRPQIHIVMTLTTPGCPLAAVFDTIIKDGLRVIDGLDVDEDVSLELTFDPPWVPEMMSEEARAELGFD